MCAAFDCTDGDGYARCADVTAADGGRNNAEGRTCSCHVSDDAEAAVSTTQYYANDTAGCIGKWGAAVLLWSVHAGRSAAPQLLTVPALLSGSAECGSTDRVCCWLPPADINACDGWPCATGAATASCADTSNAPNTTEGSTCTCPNGYAYEGEDAQTGGCQGAQQCCWLLV